MTATLLPCSFAPTGRGRSVPASLPQPNEVRSCRAPDLSALLHQSFSPRAAFYSKPNTQVCPFSSCSTRGPQTRGARHSRRSPSVPARRRLPPPRRAQRRLAHLAPTAARKPEAVRCAHGPARRGGKVPSRRLWRYARLPPSLTGCRDLLPAFSVRK